MCKTVNKCMKAITVLNAVSCLTEKYC